VRSGLQVLFDGGGWQLWVLPLCMCCFSTSCHVIHHVSANLPCVCHPGSEPFFVCAVGMYLGRLVFVL
jgi:hypothetical protein